LSLCVTIQACDRAILGGGSLPFLWKGVMRWRYLSH